MDVIITEGLMCVFADSVSDGVSDVNYCTEENSSNCFTVVVPL